MWKRQPIALALLVAGLGLLVALLAVQQVTARRRDGHIWLDALNRGICGRRLARPPARAAQLTRADLEEISEQYDDTDSNAEHDSDYFDSSQDFKDSDNLEDLDDLDDLDNVDNLDESAEETLGSEKGNSSLRISAGRPAWRGEFPWYVELQFRWPGGGYKTEHCGGVLIHKNLVLTAAHCVINTKGLPMVDLLLVSGLTNLTSSPARQNVQAEAMLVHSGYNYSLFDSANSSPPLPVQRNDVALVRVKYDFRYDLYTQPACLADANIERFLSSCWTTGFGLMDERTGKEPGNMMTMPMDRYHKPMAKSRDELVYISADSHQYPGRPCYGDSGSPLICPDNAANGHAAQFFARGLTSNGPKFGCRFGIWEPMFLVDIAYHYDGILKMARRLLDAQITGHRSHRGGVQLIG